MSAQSDDAYRGVSVQTCRAVELSGKTKLMVDAVCKGQTELLILVVAGLVLSTNQKFAEIEIDTKVLLANGLKQRQDNGEQITEDRESENTDSASLSVPS